MGKLITFWSPYAGQSKVTSTMCAIAGALGVQYPELELAITQTKPGTTELADCLDFRNRPGERKELYEKFGLQALALNYRQAVLTSERIRHCAIPLLHRSIYLFPGPGKRYTMDEVQVRLITENLVREFPAVLLDLESGWTEESLRFMKTADTVVVVLPQNILCWNRFFKEDITRLEGKEVCIMLGGYLEKSKYGPGYFSQKREYRAYGALLGAVPLNAGYMDAMAEGKALEFFLRNECTQKNEENYEFIKQTKKAAEQFRKKIFLP